VKPDHTVELRPVVIQNTLDGQVVILKGLTVGETVVTDGQLALIPGASVDIKPSSRNLPDTRPR